MPKQNMLTEEQIQVIYEKIKQRINEELGISAETKLEIQTEYQKLSAHNKRNLFTSLSNILKIDKKIIYNYVRYHFGTTEADKIQKPIREKLCQQISNLQQYNYTKEQIWDIIKQQYKNIYDKEKLYNCFKYIYNQQNKTYSFTIFNKLDDYQVDNQMQQSLIGQGIEIDGLWDYIKDQLYLSEPFLEHIYL